MPKKWINGRLFTLPGESSETMKRRQRGRIMRNQSSFFKNKAPNPNAPSALQKQPTAVFKVGKVPIKRKMLEQTPVAMANATTSTKYAPPRKTRKANRL